MPRPVEDIQADLEEALRADKLIAPVSELEKNPDDNGIRIVLREELDRTIAALRAELDQALT